MIERVMSAAQYEVHVLRSAEEIKAESFEDTALLVLAESTLRGELGDGELGVVQEHVDAVGQRPHRLVVRAPPVRSRTENDGPVVGHIGE